MLWPALLPHANTQNQAQLLMQLTEYITNWLLCRTGLENKFIWKSPLRLTLVASFQDRSKGWVRFCTGSEILYGWVWNIIRFCTGSEISYGWVWNIIRFCTGSEISYGWVWNTIRFCTGSEIWYGLVWNITRFCTGSEILYGWVWNIIRFCTGSEILYSSKKD